MERRRFEKEQRADTRLPPLPRSTLHSPRWSLRGVANNLPVNVRVMLERYGVALVLAGLVLLFRGRWPGLFASVVCATGVLYWFVPPRNSFDISRDYAPAFWIFIALCADQSAWWAS